MVMWVCPKSIARPSARPATFVARCCTHKRTQSLSTCLYLLFIQQGQKVVCIVSKVEMIVASCCVRKIMCKLRSFMCPNFFFLATQSSEAKTKGFEYSIALNNYLGTLHQHHSPSCQQLRNATRGFEYRWCSVIGVLLYPSATYLNTEERIASLTEQLAEKEKQMLKLEQTKAGILSTLVVSVY